MRTGFTLILILALAAPGDGPQGPGRRAARLGEHAGDRRRRHGRGSRAGRPRPELERLAEPVYRFDDRGRGMPPTGPSGSGARSGRPVAVMTVTRHRAVQTRATDWLTELTSLAPGPIIRPTSIGIGTWQPSRRGSSCGSSRRPAPPAEDAAQRLRQMKELVRQIRARENFRPRERVPRPSRSGLRAPPPPQAGAPLCGRGVGLDRRRHVRHCRTD